MVFKVKERYSFYPEYTDLLLKYDLNSSVRRDSTRFDDITLTVPAIGNANHEDMEFNFSDLYKLKYAIGVDIKRMEKKIRSVFKFKDKTICNERDEKFVYELLEQYQECLLKHKDHTALTITNYLSLCEKLKLVDLRRLKVINFVLKVLIGAGINDHCVCRKLFLFVEHKGLREGFLSSLDPGDLVYLLKNLCNQVDNHEYIWKYISMRSITNWGCLDNLKVTLDFKSCVELNPEDMHRSFNDLFECQPSADVSLEEYSSERLMLLLQMAYIMQPESDESDLDDFENSGGSREKAIEAVKLSWKTIPQAYFTWQEMKDVLDRLFIKCLPSDLDQFDKNEIEGKIQAAVEEYKRTFDVPVKKPRSLKNYARIAVRKRCRTAGAVDELVPAKRLRAYVKLQ